MIGPELIQALKFSAGGTGPQFCLPVGKPAFAWMRPVAMQSARQSKQDVELLTKWRNANVGAFLTEFVATQARTSAWLAGEFARDDSRILFMLDDDSGETVGYMGLAYIDWSSGYGEADSIVKGVPTRKGLATVALTTLIDWAKGSLGLSTIGVRVRSDNPALGFYLKLGFVELRRNAMVRTESCGQVSWHEDTEITSSSPSLVHMRHLP